MEKAKLVEELELMTYQKGQLQKGLAELKAKIQLKMPDLQMIVTEKQSLEE